MSNPRQAAQVMDDPAPLWLKFGAVGPIEPALIARADAALARISHFFGPWLGEEIQKLAAVRAGIRRLGYTDETAAALNIRAHELKSMGATFGFPIITDIADCFCRMIDEPETRMTAPLYLIDAHIDAIAAAARDNIRDSDHPVGRALVSALDDRVRAYLAAATAAGAKIKRNIGHG